METTKKHSAEEIKKYIMYLQNEIKNNSYIKHKFNDKLNQLSEQIDIKDADLDAVARESESIAQQIHEEYVTSEHFTATYLAPVGEKFLVDEENPDIYQQMLELKLMRIHNKHFKSWNHFLRSIGNMTPHKEQFDTWLCGLRH